MYHDLRLLTKNQKLTDDIVKILKNPEIYKVVQLTPVDPDVNTEHLADDPCVIDMEQMTDDLPPGPTEETYFPSEELVIDDLPPVNMEEALTPHHNSKS